MAKFIGFLLLFVIVVGFAIPSLFLDKAFAMDRATTIGAPAKDVHDVVSDFTTWDEWTAWTKEEDPTLEFEYSGSPGQVGHSMSWTGDELGNGTLTLTEVTPDAVRYSMVFDDMAPSQGAILIEERSGGQTAVQWSFSGEFEGMPYWRYMGLMMDRMTGPSFEQGLEKLKVRLESK